MRRAFSIPLLLGAFLWGSASHAQSPQTGEKGRIQGKVVDARTGEGLPGANVAVKGTYYGASSSIDGEVKIEKVNPGVYVVTVSLLGYKTVQYSSLNVEAGKTAMFQAKMEETVIAGQEVVVVGEKPMFDIEETSSRRNVDQADIKAAAIQNVQSIVSMQAGVVQADNEIHIRGGRTHENAYLLDGVSVQDPLAGTGFGLQLSPSSIQEVEVITGGYNAEYGQATSGIVNITTREGADRYSGTVSYTSDHLGNAPYRGNWMTDIFDGTLSGPEPLTTYLMPSLGLRIPGQVSFFASVHGNFADGYTRWVETVGMDNRVDGRIAVSPNQLYSSIWGGAGWAPRGSNHYSWLAKLTYKPTSESKISYAYSQSVGIDQNTQNVQATLERVEPNPGYQYRFQYIPDSANTYTQVNIQNSITWTQTLSKQTFFELRLSAYSAHLRGDANGKDFTSYALPQDIVRYPVRYYNQGTDTVGVVPGDGFYDVGSPTQWRDHSVDDYTIKFDLTSFFTERNKFKTGLEMRFQTMQMVDLVDPWVKPLGYDNDIYTVYPALGALYAQDNITIGGMILNFGLRLDYWAPGKYVDDIAADTSSALIVSPALRAQYEENTFTLFGRHFKARLSPRLGVSHPVSDNQSLFFSYGHFSKFPRPQYVYSKLDRTNVRSMTLVGNPDLGPETTVAYELGLRNQLSGNDVLTVTAYYKDIFDYVTGKSVQRITPTGVGQTYSTYLNSDYGRVLGIELEYKKRIGNWFRGSLSGTYSSAAAKSSAPNEEIVRLQQGEPENIKELPVIWDRPVQASLTLNLTVPKGDPLFGVDPLDDINLFVRAFFQSGKRYTPQIQAGTDPSTGRPLLIDDFTRINQNVGANWFWIDMNLDKSFDLGFCRFIVSVEVQNLLDTKNSQIVNPATGRAYEYGDRTPVSYNDPLYPDLTGDIVPFPYNPARYLNPRTVRFGLAYQF